MSIVSEITRLSSAKAALKDAIVAKGVDVSDSLKLDGYAEKVAAISTGGAEVEYPVPWRNDGKIHYWLHIDKYIVGEEVVFYMAIKSSTGVTIDWGDGTTTELDPSSSRTFVTFSHIYARKGDYEVVFTGVEEWLVNNYWSGPYNDAVGPINGSAMLVSAVRQIEMGVTAESFYIYGRGSAAITGMQAILINAKVLAGEIPQCIKKISVERYDNATFLSCESRNMLSEIDLSGYSNLTNIPVLNFCNALKEIDLSHNTSIENITGNALLMCFALRKIVLPDSVVSIGSGYVFNGCILDEMEVKSIIPPTVTGGMPRSIGRLIVPKGTLEAYQNANNWTIFKNVMVEAE